MMLLTILSLIMILVVYGGWNGQKAGISFLVLLVTLKFLEANKLRDYYVVCLILYFLAASSFLFNSSLINILLVILYVILVSALLLKITNPTPPSLSRSLRTAAGILGKALPLAIILFFLFPRIQGTFGFIPSQDEIDTDNELSDSLVAGDFASSAFNNELAFYVKFSQGIPRNSQLYWRAKVMTEERNFQWSVTLPKHADRSKLIQRKRSIETSQNTVSYEIVHQNSTDSFAPFLDYVLDQKLGIQLDDFSVFLLRKSNGVFAYSGVSTGLPNLTPVAAFDPAPLLLVRSIPTPRIAALLQQWKQSSSSNQDLVEQALSHFRNREFYYSLTPPGLGDNPIDQFLFETREGYCEHYASTFTILMRWLGIPARVVVGYQGGSRNSVGDYLQVRYSDAHAWSEVWLNNRWVRVDPTAAISPERIEYGMDAVMDLWLNGSLRSNSAPALANFLNPSGFSLTLRKITDGWENIGYQWDKWVVNYDFDSQRLLLTNLGFKHKNSLALLLGLLATGTMVLMLFYFWQLIPRAIRIGEAQRLYLDFVNKFRGTKLFKAPAVSPNEFGAKFVSELPHLADEVRLITQIYVNLRYGKPPNSTDENFETNEKILASFKKQVKSFRLTTPSTE
jgi:transglutaminase-like putative cysteine protease